MPVSVSSDQGKTWTSRGSEFPWITFVQRPVLLRLEYSDPTLDPEGRGRQPLLLISIAREGIPGRDANGKETTIQGTFAAFEPVLGHGAEGAMFLGDAFHCIPDE